MLIWMFAGCIEPTSGIYDVAVEDTITDCPEDAAPTSADAWRERLVIRHDAAHIQVFEGDSGTCPRSEAGLGFDCELAWLDTTADYASGGVDARIDVDVDLRGEWTDDRTIAGEITHEVTCTGAACDAARAVSPPVCATTWTWTGSLP